ncbi:MAG TPA: hypothetical protein VIK56_00165 [Rhodoferax sp.]
MPHGTAAAIESAAICRADSMQLWAQPAQPALSVQGRGGEKSVVSQHWNDRQNECAIKSDLCSRAIGLISSIHELIATAA